jgi:hypothetical protein
MEGGTEVKQVFQAHDITEAHLVKGLLESHGLSALVRGEALSGTAGEVPFVDVWPTVWVLDDVREGEARAVIKEYERGPAKPGSPGVGWLCPKCGQDLEPQFTACWACGGGRPPGGPET